MTSTSAGATPPPPAPRDEAGRVRDWARSAAIGTGLLVLYLANGREIGQYDTEPTTLATLAILRGEGPYLDRFRPVLYEAPGRLFPFVAESRGHILSRYPLGSAVLAAPIAWPLVLWLDQARPDWDAHPGVAWAYARLLSKFSAAVMAALTAVLLDRLIRRLGLGRVAVPAVIAAALGSNLWTVGSQALWQHGPAALMLTAAWLLLTHDRPGPGRLALAGLAAAMMVACRAIDVVLASVMLAWVVWAHGKRAAWFLPGPLLVGACLLSYNLYFFGAISGGQAALEAMHPELHGVASPWAGDLAGGALGTLLSPARGLLVYSPWVALSAAVLPWSFRLLPLGGVARWLIVGLVPYGLLLAKYAVWWAGHTFGPRYWTDVVPILGVVLALGFEWARRRSRVLTLGLTLGVVVSIGVQVIGAFCFPSSWNLKPRNVDRHHERLWDWRDTELSRCLIEAMEARGKSRGRGGGGGRTIRP